MANKYANLIGTNKINVEYTKITAGFDAVEADMDAVNERVTNEVSAVETALSDEVEAREELETRVDTILTEQDLDPNKDSELVDIRTPDSSYTPLEEISVAGDITRDMQKQFVAHKADLAKVGLDYNDDDGDPRGTGAVDLQHTRTDPSQVAGGQDSFAAGAENTTKDTIKRGLRAIYARAMGSLNRALSVYSRAEGRKCFADGQVAHAEGNVCIASANDSHAEGNRTVTGRRYYPDVTYGSEDAGDDLGTLQYVLIPDIEGDVTSYFPNPLTDNVSTRYLTGSQKDEKGNIYPPGMTPAVWDGDVPTTPNDLQWAMHSVCILRGPSEPDIEYVDIAKATYSAGVGTKVYYYGSRPFSSIIWIYSSYAPTVLIGGNGGFRGGNGNHAQGLATSAFGYGAHAQGANTRAWADYAHAQGYFSEARGVASFAGGQYGFAKRNNQRSVGVGRISVRGDNQLTEIQYTKNLPNAGWHLLEILMDCEDGKAYHFDTMVIGRQKSGTAGTVGDTFAYRFSGLVMLSGGSYTVIGTPERTLVGRSSGMSGDGLSTGVRIAWSTTYLPGIIGLRYDGIADATFHATVYSRIQEMGL